MEAKRGSSTMDGMAGIAPLMSADELLALPRGEFRYELLHGVLLKMTPPGGIHGESAAAFTARLWSFLDGKRLGRVLVETGFRLSRDPDHVLAPDVSFVSAARIPAGGLPHAYVSGPPDLAIEIISSNDRFTDVQNKVADYLKFGTRMVVVVEPRGRRFTVHCPGEPSQVLEAESRFDAGTVVPGFSFLLGDYFGGAARD